MKLNDAVFGAVLLVLGLAVLGHVQSFATIPGQRVGPGLFPGVIAGGLIVCAILLIVGGVRSRHEHPWFEALPWMGSRSHAAAFAAVIGVVVAYILLAQAAGFLLVAPVFLFVLFVVFGVRPGPATLIAVVVTVAIWYAFYKLLRVPLPWGVLTPWAF